MSRRLFSQPARRVPYAKYEKLKDNLEQHEQHGIVAKVDKPTDWVSNLIITEKKRWPYENLPRPKAVEP